MSTRFLAGLALAATLAGGTQLEAQTNLLTLLTNGPTARRINIVFLSEGYTTNDLVNFEGDARVMLNQMISAPPLGEYSNYFNAFAISVPSQESGADHQTPTVILRDTFFNATFDTGGIQRLLTIDSVGRSRALALLAQYLPEYDIVAVVVNDTQYGGSGGSILVSSINVQSPEIATHEMGHTFAGLGDEYDYAGATPSERPNATQQTNLALIKWNVWIPPGTPIPTPATSPYYNVVGLFRGAVYSTNYFRPKYNCKMRALGVDFCEVCSETLIKTIYSKISMIEGFVPATNSIVRLTNGVPTPLSLTPLLPATHPLSLQWFTNNVAVAGATSSVFSVNGFTLPTSGTNSIRVDVADPTVLVRAAPTNMMMTSLNWKTTFQAVNPVLAIAANSSELSLTWPETAAGMYVEESTNLLEAIAWTPILLISNQTGIQLNANKPEDYYRLHQP